jgi:hypothetical protein
LKYAIGEIILVVLGILIALYINNQNEIKKEQEMFDQVLVEVEQELIYDIHLARKALDFYAYTDSLFLRILVDTLDIEDYSHSDARRELTGAAYLLPYDVTLFKDDSFKKLNQIVGSTTKQQSLFQYLIDVFEYQLGTVLESSKYFKEEMIYERRKFRKHDWYRKYLTNQLDDETIIDYFLNDPEYLNTAHAILILNTQARYALSLFDKHAVSVYEEIHEYLDSLELREKDSLLFDYDPEEYNHYLGKYSSKWCSDKNFIHDDSITVSLEEGKMTYRGYRPDGHVTKHKIIPINKYRFRNQFGGIYHLKFDKHGDVQGIRFSYGHSFTLDMEKIR